MRETNDREDAASTTAAERTEVHSTQGRGIRPGQGDAQAEHSGRTGPGTAIQTTQEIDQFQGALVALEFGVGKSLRYHRKRRSFFEFLHHATMLVATVGATGAFIALQNEVAWGANAAALLVAVTTLLDALINYQSKARTHDSLCRSYSDLKAEMVRVGEPSPEQLRDWRARRIEIEKDEPTPLSVLNVLCHNEQATAAGYGPDQHYRIWFWQHMFCHFLSLPPSTIKPLKR
jgi:hypothetical protein